jgi:hypothetical protein
LSSDVDSATGVHPTRVRQFGIARILTSVTNRWQHQHERETPKRTDARRDREPNFRVGRVLLLPWNEVSAFFDLVLGIAIQVGTGEPFSGHSFRYDDSDLAVTTCCTPLDFIGVDG